MGDKTGISWADATWNPVLGCAKVSTGCRNCYAMRVAHRMASNPNVKIRDAYEGLTKSSAEGPTWTGKVRILPSRLDQPIRWRRPRRVFVNSMSDLFHPDVPFRFIAAVFGVMASAPHHIFQVLTKRPKRAREFFDWLEARGRLVQGDIFRGDDVEWCIRQQIQAAALAYGTHPRGMGKAWPLPNVWMGVSVETADHFDRVEALRTLPAAVRFLSCEPLLGPLDTIDLKGIDWVIAGDESGARRRGALLSWASGLRDACLEAGVPFFLKQWHSSAGVKQELPLLDGRQWQEMPSIAP